MAEGAEGRRSNESAEMRAILSKIKPGELASLLEADETIRRRVLEKHPNCFTRWPPTAVGVPSTKAMTFNVRALEILATWWTGMVPFVKALPIKVLRKEAGMFALGALVVYRTFP